MRLHPVLAFLAGLTLAVAVPVFGQSFSLPFPKPSFKPPVVTMPTANPTFQQMLQRFQFQKPQEAKTCEDGHAIGESFKSSDGCNTCSCNENGIICTLRACAAPDDQPQPGDIDPGEKTCFSSKDCTDGDQICSTELGECRSPCGPDEVCTQVCSGVCTEKKPDPALQCAPGVCKDGTVFATCSADGHPINYFADPCLTHQG